MNVFRKRNTLSFISYSTSPPLEEVSDIVTSLWISILQDGSPLANISGQQFEAGKEGGVCQERLNLNQNLCESKQTLETTTFHVSKGTFEYVSLSVPLYSDTYMESLKLFTSPGASPGVGLSTHGFCILHSMPCSHGNTPAEGRGLLG